MMHFGNGDKPNTHCNKSDYMRRETIDINYKILFTSM